MKTRVCFKSKWAKLPAVMILCSCAMLLSAQENSEEAEITKDDGRGWVFGLNFGVYYPSKYTAAYYNGESANENNANYVISNYYWYQEIYNLLGAHDSIFIYGLPQNMHYKMAMRPGMFAGYTFNESFSITIEFNYMKLRADDAIVFEVDPKPFATEPDLRLYKIRGVEERVYADIGARHTLNPGNKVEWYFTGGLNINSTRVQKSCFYIEEKEYSMVNTYGNSTYIPGAYNQSFSVYQGGIGIGVFGGAGATVSMSNAIHLEPGFTAHWLKVNLDRYKQMKPGIGVYLRFLF